MRSGTSATDRTNSKIGISVGHYSFFQDDMLFAERWYDIPSFLLLSSQHRLLLAVFPSPAVSVSALAIEPIR